MNSFGQRLFITVIGLVVVLGIYLAMRPQPVAVDTAIVSRGPLVVTIGDDGKTRIRERYVVSAPLHGRLVRIKFNPGDEVVAHETLLTNIEPTESSLLDPRSIAQAKSRVKAAEARQNRATPQLKSASVALNHAEAEMGRLQDLVNRNAGSQQALDFQRVIFQKAGHDYEAATFEIEIAKFELDVAKAALTRTGKNAAPGDWSFPVTSPISGRVLRVFQESSTIVAAGERILEIGDASDLEIEVDVLSTDAVRIKPGARVILEQWGGDEPLSGRVRLIEPSAFTKVSALGIEEQRVDVIIDFTDKPNVRPALGDGYRLEASIVVWESPDVLTVPTGALFRSGDEWAVFVVRGSRAQLATIELGHRNDDAAEVREGLQESDRVILYPGDRIEDGVALKARESLKRSTAVDSED